MQIAKFFSNWYHIPSTVPDIVFSLSTSISQYAKSGKNPAVHMGFVLPPIGTTESRHFLSQHDTVGTGPTQPLYNGKLCQERFSLLLTLYEVLQPSALMAIRIGWRVGLTIPNHAKSKTKRLINAAAMGSVEPRPID